jgi:hypothetical protein
MVEQQKAKCYREYDQDEGEGRCPISEKKICLMPQTVTAVHYRLSN